MKFYYCILFAAFISCNEQDKKNSENKIVADSPVVAKAIVPDDPITAKVRAAITAIQTQDLQFVSKIRGMFIDSLRYQMISMKDFYTVRKAKLLTTAHLSSDKEKTNRAMAYLDKMISTSSADTTIYKVQFHLNASLENNTVYNEGHTKYLKPDLSEVKVVFPKD